MSIIQIPGYKNLETLSTEEGRIFLKVESPLGDIFFLHEFYDIPTFNLYHKEKDDMENISWKDILEDSKFIQGDIVYENINITGDGKILISSVLDRETLTKVVDVYHSKNIIQDDSFVCYPLFHLNDVKNSPNKYAKLGAKYTKMIYRRYQKKAERCGEKYKNTLEEIIDLSKSLDKKMKELKKNLSSDKEYSAKDKAKIKMLINSHQISICKNLSKCSEILMNINNNCKSLHNLEQELDFV